jgi:5-oxoprolinase (ATP-hydrolysing) subunit A
VLLELDAGERDDEPDELWALFDVLNVACGGHAGDAASMTRVARFCAGRATPRIGAHPSYPDREGFGRRTTEVTPDALADEIERQCAALVAITGTARWLKPHGALYHDAAANPALARAVVAGAMAALGKQIVVIGPARGALRDAAAAAGLTYLREGFADRGTRADGSLVPRNEPGALVLDPTLAAERARALVTGGAVDAICVHGDTPGALAIARAVREALDA